MTGAVDQQIVISGVGGQGVLFITGLMAEAAINKGLSVMTSETHGMAQRGGTVVSHLKVGPYTSPLIRPGKADGMLALKAEIPDAHLMLLNSNNWAAVNSEKKKNYGEGVNVFDKDCENIARELGSPKSVNLVLLGFAIAATAGESVKKPLFFSIKDIKNILLLRLSEKKEMLQGAISALEAGYNSFTLTGTNK